MTVPVILYGSPVLRKHSDIITDTDDIGTIIQMLSDTLSRAGGIGLAAPQISLLKRIFIIDTSLLSEDEMLTEKFSGAFINPEILDFSSEISVFKEGCLSIPEIYEDVKRPEKILVKYIDPSLNTKEEELAGIKARIFQHELEHLDGILFIDRINSLRRKLIRGKLNSIRKMASKSYNYY